MSHTNTTFIACLNEKDRVSFEGLMNNGGKVAHKHDVIMNKHDGIMKSTQAPRRKTYKGIHRPLSCIKISIRPHCHHEMSQTQWMRAAQN